MGLWKAVVVLDGSGVRFSAAVYIFGCFSSAQGTDAADEDDDGVDAGHEGEGAIVAIVAIVDDRPAT